MGYWTLKATTSRVMNEMESIFDDPKLNQKLIRDKVLVQRANVLSKFLMVYPGAIPSQYINECCVNVVCEPVCKGSPITHHYAYLPATLGRIGNKGYTFVGSADGKTAFEQKTEASNDVEDYISFGYNESKDNPYYVLVGNRAAIYNRPTDNMSILLVRGVFSDPHFCGCDEDLIFVPEDHLDEIEQNIKRDLATFLIQRRIDKMNNSNTDN